MLNQTVLVGRLVEEVEVKETDNGRVANITLAVPRSYKNEEGIYETDFIPCTLAGQIAQSAGEYCKKGDLVGVKGRLQSENNGLALVAEKLTFLSSKAPNDGE